MVAVLQGTLQGVQRLGAVLPDGTSSPAARTSRPRGPLPQAGGPVSGGGGQPGSQLEGRTHDASVAQMLAVFAHCIFM